MNDKECPVCKSTLLTRTLQEHSEYYRWGAKKMIAIRTELRKYEYGCADCERRWIEFECSVGLVDDIPF